jgi:hippurate hydrolase
MAVFQPGEETAQGARAMIDDGLLTRFPKPDVVLGHHSPLFAPVIHPTLQTGIEAMIAGALAWLAK